MWRLSAVGRRSGGLKDLTGGVAGPMGAGSGDQPGGLTVRRSGRAEARAFLLPQPGGGSAWI